MMSFTNFIANTLRTWHVWACLSNPDQFESSQMDRVVQVDTVRLLDTHAEIFQTFCEAQNELARAAAYVCSAIQQPSTMPGSPLHVYLRPTHAVGALCRTAEELQATLNLSSSAQPQTITVQGRIIAASSTQAALHSRAVRCPACR